MNNANIYVESKFWDDFIRLSPQNTFEPEESDWRNFFFLLLKGNLFFDFDKSALKQKVLSDPYFKFINKAWGDGRCRVNTNDSNAFVSLRDAQARGNNLNSIFLYKPVNDGVDEIQQLEGGNYGIMSFTPQDCVLSGLKYFKDNGVNVARNSEFSWKDIKDGFSHKNNSLIIIDNYILREKERNLYALFEELLPDTLSERYDISVFTKLDKLEGCHQELYSKIKQMRPNLEFSLSVHDSADNFHDRVVLTNYCVMTCGAGFDLINKRGRASKATVIQILFPFLNTKVDWAGPLYETTIMAAKKVARIARHFPAEVENRLLKD